MVKTPSTYADGFVSRAEVEEDSSADSELGATVVEGGAGGSVKSRDGAAGRVDAELEAASNFLFISASVYSASCTIDLFVEQSSSRLAVRLSILSFILVICSCS